MKDLEWLRTVLISIVTAAGGGGLFKLLRSIQQDFLGPYRNEVKELRTEVAGLRAEVAAARTEKDLSLTWVAILKRTLIEHGIDVPPLPGEDLHRG